jgi:hypothetical protein
MTKLETNWYPEIIPGFDAIEYKRKIQAEIFEETKHMTPEQRRERARLASEEFWAGVERLRADRAATVQT